MTRDKKKASQKLNGSIELRTRFSLAAQSHCT